MIKEIVSLLAMDDWLVGDPDIDFAKGSHSITLNLKELKLQNKRKKCRYRRQHM